MADHAHAGGAADTSATTSHVADTTTSHFVQHHVDTSHHSAPTYHPPHHDPHHHHRHHDYSDPNPPDYGTINTSTQTGVCPACNFAFGSNANCRSCQPGEPGSREENLALALLKGLFFILWMVLFIFWLVGFSRAVAEHPPWKQSP